jgi:hypothetical protein
LCTLVAFCPSDPPDWMIPDFSSPIPQIRGNSKCGAFQAIADHVDREGDEVVVVADTSIGAVNASIIASAYQAGNLPKEKR